MAEIERKTKRYPTDLTDEEWSRIETFLPRPAATGRPRDVDLREVLNAVRYLVRTGCGWRMLPKDFPPWQTVYWWFRRFVRRLLFRTLHDVALMIDRERSGREAVGSGTGAPTLGSGGHVQPFRSGPQSGSHRLVSSSRHVKPSVPFSGTGLTCWLHTKVYGTYRPGALSDRTRLIP